MRRVCAGARGDRADEIDAAQFLVGVDVVGTRDGADLDREHVGQRHAVDAAREGELPAGEHHAPAVVRAMREVVLLEAPDRAVGQRAVEHLGVAQFDEIGDRAFAIQPRVERHARGGLEKIARRDEDQFAARRQVVEALVDEEQVEVGAPVEPPRLEQRARGVADVLVAHVGRVADDGVELLVRRIGEEILHPRTAAARNAHRVRSPCKSAMRFENAPSPAAGSSVRPLRRRSASIASTMAGGVNTWPRRAMSRAAAGPEASVTFEAARSSSR